ncbi:MAG: ribosome biogenesis GTPase Der [Candidatus Binatia bacterium]
MIQLRSTVQGAVRAPARLSDSGGLPLLAIVGRPNTGKSSLFNRLTRGKKAIVDDLPGVTRDRNYGEAEWRGRRFLLIDTGGFEPDPNTALKAQIQQQSRLAMEEADAIVLLFDGKVGLNPLDREAVRLLRQVEKPVFFAVNKIDTKPKENLLYEFYGLGLSEIFPLSAEHGLGLSALMDRVVGVFPSREGDGQGVMEPGRSSCLAIVGRPNVGKSALVNRLLGYERSVVDPLPGTTRDALDSPLTWGEEQYTLVDTAGIRRKARIADRIERYSVVRALRSVDRGDLIIHLLDGSEGVTGQDAQILAYALKRGKGVVLAVNKWDLVPEFPGGTGNFRAQVYKKLSFLDFAPVVFISALTGYGISKLMGLVQRVSVSHWRWIRTSTLNQALREVVRRHPPPPFQDREVKLYYATQTATGPPTFTLFANRTKGITPSYKRYLIHQLRSALGLDNSPISLILRDRREKEGGMVK